MHIYNIYNIVYIYTIIYICIYDMMYMYESSPLSHDPTPKPDEICSRHQLFRASGTVLDQRWTGTTEFSGGFLPGGWVGDVGVAQLKGAKGEW